MRQLRNGETSAIGVLYVRYFRCVLADCRRILRDQEAARDLTNDVFVRVIHKSALFHEDKPGSFPAWLRCMAQNLCFNYLKKGVIARSVPLDGDPTVQESEMTDLSPFTVEEVEAALERLSDKQRVCLKMFYIEERSYDEIVRSTGMRAGEVRSAIQNGKLRLKRMLGNSRRE